MSVDTTPAYAAVPARLGPGQALAKLVLTEARLLLREPVALFWGLAFPMGLLAVMGIASSGPGARLRRPAAGRRLRADPDRVRHRCVRHPGAARGRRRLPGTADPAPPGDHPGRSGPGHRGPAGRQPGGCPGGDGRDPYHRPARLRGGPAGQAGGLRYVCAGRRGDARSRDAGRGAGAHRPRGRRHRDHAVLPADVSSPGCGYPGPRCPPACGRSATSPRWARPSRPCRTACAAPGRTCRRWRCSPDTPWSSPSRRPGSSAGTSRPRGGCGAPAAPRRASDCRAGRAAPGPRPPGSPAARATSGWRRSPGRCRSGWSRSRPPRWS